MVWLRRKRSETNLRDMTMTTRKNCVAGMRQSVRVPFLIGLVLVITQSATAQWATNGSNINNTNTGFVGVGTTAPMSPLHVAAALSTPTRGLIVSQHTDDASSAFMTLMKARGSLTAPTAVLNGDLIGSLFSQAYDGTSYVLGSRMRFAV